MEYLVGIKIVICKEKEDDLFGFSEEVKYIDTPFNTRQEALGFITQVIIANVKGKSDEEYYFKYSNGENRYNRGYISASSNILSSDYYVNMIIKEAKNEKNM